MQKRPWHWQICSALYSRNHPSLTGQRSASSDHSWIFQWWMYTHRTTGKITCLDAFGKYVWPRSQNGAAEIEAWSRDFRLGTSMVYSYDRGESHERGHSKHRIASLGDLRFRFLFPFRNFLPMVLREANQIHYFLETYEDKHYLYETSFYIQHGRQYHVVHTLGNWNHWSTTETGSRYYHSKVRRYGACWTPTKTPNRICKAHGCDAFEGWYFPEMTLGIQPRVVAVYIQPVLTLRIRSRTLLPITKDTLWSWQMAISLQLDHANVVSRNTPTSEQVPNDSGGSQRLDLKFHCEVVTQLHAETLWKGMIKWNRPQAISNVSLHVVDYHSRVKYCRG